MSDFFRSSSSNVNSKPDVAAQKEALLNAIRTEISLATAQELISAENVREMLRKVRSEARGIVVELGRDVFDAVHGPLPRSIQHRESDAFQQSQPAWQGKYVVVDAEPVHSGGSVLKA